MTHELTQTPADTKPVARSNRKREDTYIRPKGSPQLKKSAHQTRRRAQQRRVQKIPRASVGTRVHPVLTDKVA